MTPCEEYETCAGLDQTVCANLRKDVLQDRILPYNSLIDDYKCGRGQYCCTDNGQYFRKGVCDPKTSSFLSYSKALGARNCLISCEKTPGIN